MALTIAEFTKAIVDGLKACCAGYCLLCQHCGKIERFLFALPPRVRPCKFCGRDMIVSACIVTRTPKQPS